MLGQGPARAMHVGSGNEVDHECGCDNDNNAWDGTQ